MICTLSKHAAERDGYADAMMLDWRGYIAEATGANVFFVRDGVIHTPTPDCFLDGITRRSVMDMARARGVEIVERHIHPDELPTFTECFITGTAAEVTPVSEIGEHRFTPGALSLALMDDFSAAVRRCPWLPESRRGRGRAPAPALCSLDQDRRPAPVAERSRRAGLPLRFRSAAD
jgi:branched-chain amino acid aminotransferase